MRMCIHKALLLMLVPCLTLASCGRPARPEHLTSLNAFRTWAVSELQQGDAFEPAHVIHMRGSFTCWIGLRTCVDLTNGERLHFLSNWCHNEEAAFGDLKVGDITMFRHKGAFFVSRDHPCSYHRIRIEPPFFADLDDFLQRSGYRWEPHDAH